MINQNLNGNWKLSINNLGYNDIEIPVPGCIENVIKEKNYDKKFTISREFDINNDFRKAFINFNGVSYFCDVFLNGEKIMSHEGMWDNFSCDVSKILRKKNVISLDIIKPGYEKESQFPLREVLTGFIADVSVTFGGIWDDVYLSFYDNAHIENNIAVCDLEGNGNINLDIISEKAESIEINYQINFQNKVELTYNKIISIDKGANNISIPFKINEPKLWNTTTPYLYDYKITIKNEDISDERKSSFGIREIATKNTNFMLNNQPIYPRGVLHWGYYDDELIPNPSIEKIQDEILKCKSMGFNMIKHCLYIPREEYLDVMDKNGMLAWIELPLWLPENAEKINKQMKLEYPRIIEQLAEHPCVVIISLGCELDDTINADILSDMYDLAKKKSGALIRDNSGSGECYGGLKTDFADFYDYHFYGDLHNMEHLMEDFTPGWRKERPWIYGEFCDIDSLRDLDIVRKQKGVSKLWWEIQDDVLNPISKLKPDFFAHLLEDRVVKNGIREDIVELQKLSNAHSIAHRKITLEMTRSFPEICGYTITSIRDVPIATSGLLDDIGNLKYDINSLAPSNNDIVILPSYDLSRVWIGGDITKNAERYNFFSESAYSLFVLISNYSQMELINPLIHWKVVNSDTQQDIEGLCGFLQSKKTVLVGEVVNNGHIEFVLPKTDKLLNLEIVVSLNGKYENRWPIFIYPKEEMDTDGVLLFDPFDVFKYSHKIYQLDKLEERKTIDINTKLIITSQMTAEILEFVKKGGKVFYIQKYGDYIKKTLATFWREGMIKHFNHEIVEEMEKGFLPDLRYFSVAPNNGFDFSEMKIGNAKIDKIVPIIRRIDTRQLTISDYLTELKIEKGKIIATTLNLDGGVGKQPSFISNNVYSRYLLNKVYKYLLM